MARYTTNGKTTATAATAANAVGAIWNPSTSKRIKCLEIHLFKLTVGAADEPVIRRTTARGTASTTITPTSTSEHEQIANPPSGWLLDVAYSVQPTFATGEMHAAIIPAAIGAGIMWVFSKEIEIPAGQGLAVVTGTALAFPACRMTVVVED